MVGFMGSVVDFVHLNYLFFMPILAFLFGYILGNASRVALRRIKGCA